MAIACAIATPASTRALVVSPKADDVVLAFAEPTGAHAAISASAPPGRGKDGRRRGIVRADDVTFACRRREHRSNGVLVFPR
jgi:hypothetical protein